MAKTGTQVSVRCPRCGEAFEISAERLVERPRAHTCGGCGLLFRVGSGLGAAFPSDPVYETDEGWYVRKADGAVLYFPDLKLLSRWALEGEVGLDDEVSKKGKAWKPVRSLPELTALLARTGAAPGAVKAQEAPPGGVAASPAPVSISDTGSWESWPEPRGPRSRTFLLVLLGFVLGAGAGYLVASRFGAGGDPVRVEDAGLLGPEVGHLAENAGTAGVPDAGSAVGVPDAGSGADAVARVDGGDRGETVTEAGSETVTGADAGAGVDAGADVRGIGSVGAARRSAVPPPARRRVRPDRSPQRAVGPTYDQLMREGSQVMARSPGRAIALFRRALTLQEATSEARAKLGRAYLRSGRLTEALGTLEEARSENPRYRPALWDLARVYERLGRTKDALAVYRALISTLDPGSAALERARERVRRLGGRLN